MASFPRLLNQLNPHKLFFIDSLGALLTILLSLLLTKFEVVFGIPSKVLYFLSFIASVFFIYSCTCFLGKMMNGFPYLKIIAIANLLYSILTMSLILYLYQQLTILGLTYFLLEVIIIVLLATIELKIAYNPGKIESNGLISEN